MKTLFHYLKPHKWLIALALLFTTVNQVFSLFAPAITGNILDELVTHPHFFDAEETLPRTLNEYLYGSAVYSGVFYFLEIGRASCRERV